MNASPTAVSGPGSVSVIMPAHNAARFISQSLESILTQNYLNFEIIVVDDGSTDNTLQILEPYAGQVKVISQVNGGPSKARNTGIKHACGEFIWFLDADDLMVPGALRATVSHLVADPAAGVAVGQWAPVNASGQQASCFTAACKPGAMDSSLMFRRMLLQTLVPTGTALCRSSALAPCGGWDESLWCAEDRDLWLRLLATGCRFDFLAVPVAQYRQHESNSTLNLPRVEQHMRLYLEKWFGDAACCDPQRALLKPYAWALALLYMAGKCLGTQNEGQIPRLMNTVCGHLSHAHADEDLINQVLWETYEKPWEEAVQSALWPKARTQVATLCWVHARLALKNWQFAEAMSWFSQLGIRHPGYFVTKFRGLYSR